MLDVALRVDRRRFAVEATFRLDAGERLGLYGPSGSGKSTILDAIAGLVPLAAGRVLLEGRDLAGVPLWQRRVGLVRQRPALFPHLKVRENVRYGVRRSGDATDGTDEEAALCGRLGIAELLDARPGQLSGGQAQRVALARALRAPSAALLLDEPFQGLDPPLRAELVRLVREEAARRALPVVLVAHELEEVQAFADRLGVLAEGRILQLAAPDELVRRPASVRVALLVGYAAVVDGGRAGEQIGIHPAAVRFGAETAAGPVLRGVLRASVPAGLGYSAEVEVGNQLVAVPCDRPPAAVGDEVDLTVTDPPRFRRDGTLADDRLSRAARPAAPALP